MPTYRFRVTQEILWAVLIAAITPVLIELSTLDPDSITDWNVWLVSLGAAALRAGVAAILALIGPGGFEKS